MSGTEITLLVVAILVVALLALFVWRAAQARRRQRLQERFGGEYDRTVAQSGDRRAAERELADREKRYAKLEIRPLDPQSRERYAQRWSQAQADFVDRPQDAVRDADRLVTEVMRERGYPTEDFDEQAAVLSVQHTETLEHYRRAHDISEMSAENRATTEELRQAMVHYRSLFTELLDSGGTDDSSDSANKVHSLDRGGNDVGRVGDAADHDDAGNAANRQHTGRHGVDREGTVRQETGAATIGRHAGADVRDVRDRRDEPGPDEPPGQPAQRASMHRDGDTVDLRDEARDRAAKHRRDNA
jgi:type II secretory pathway pseudopilin PulG